MRMSVDVPVARADRARERRGELQRGLATPTALGELLAREVDDDVPHRLRRIGEEVLAAGDREPLRVHEAQEALVDQSGRLEVRDAAL